MKVTHAGRQITVNVTADGDGLVSHAGSALLAQVADKTGLTRALSVAVAHAASSERPAHGDERVPRERQAQTPVRARVYERPGSFAGLCGGGRRRYLAGGRGALCWGCAEFSNRGAEDQLGQGSRRSRLVQPRPE